MAKLVTKLGGFGTNLVKGVVPRLQTFKKYALVELLPPSPTDLPAISKGFANLAAGARTGKWKNLTVREATINTVVTFEIIFLFFIGECIGKGSIIGYQIPGCINTEPDI